MESIENDMDERIFHYQKIKKWLNERKLQIQRCKVKKAKAFVASLIYTKSSGTVSGKGNESSSSAARQGMITNQGIKAINTRIKVVGQGMNAAIQAMKTIILGTTRMLMVQISDPPMKQSQWL
nr:hypothetical protein [Tanacetum cinerariifolium]